MVVFTSGRSGGRSVPLQYACGMSMFLARRSRIRGLLASVVAYKAAGGGTVVVDLRRAHTATANHQLHEHDCPAPCAALQTW